MTSLLERLGRTTARHGWRTLGVWLVALAALGGLAGRFGGGTADSFEIPGAESQAALDLLNDRFPAEAGDSARVVFAAPEGSSLADPAALAAMVEVAREVRTQPHVVDVTDLTSPAGARQISPLGNVAFLSVAYDVDHTELGPAAVDRLDEAAETARTAGLQAELGGDVVEFAGTGLGGVTELVGLGVAVLVLLVAFGSVVAMGLPLITAVAGLGAGMLIVTIGTAVVDVPSFAPALATMIGLGVGIDYALFLVTRHREHLAAGMDVVTSAARATATAGQAVVFAGSTVVIAILGLRFVGIPPISAVGYATAVTVAVAVMAAITLLPAVLGLVGHRIDSLRLPGASGPAADGSSSWAGRWSGRVARRPWPYLAGSLLVLVVLAVPVASLELGASDAGARPPSDTARRAYDLLAEGFGPGFSGPLVIAVDLTEASGDALDVLTRSVLDDAGVLAVAPPRLNDAGDTAVVAAFPSTSPQERATRDTVERLRSQVIPTVAGATGARAAITGSVAAFIDISAKINDRLPVFIGAVLLLSFVLLMVVFRSLLVPFKAAVVNLLGIGAAYGVMVAVFQWGWGMHLIGIEETAPINPTLPMFMFAILFGLSMDYEVFLMSRIREGFVEHGDNIRSVETGISTTARVITAAAVIMVSVFGSFAFNDDLAIKMCGVGLSAAILLDATIVRLMLVPATMALAGRANWWLPGWLDRILPRIDLEGSAPPPVDLTDAALRHRRPRPLCQATTRAGTPCRRRAADGEHCHQHA